MAIHARPLDEEFMLLLYSDGVVEHEALSPDAIEQLLSDADDAKGVHALFEKRVEALSSLDDDTTLIALQGVKGG